YYYVYTGHGDTIALTDATGAVVASYTYDAWAVVTSDTESFPNGWHNPYLYDGRDGARYDVETGLYWLAVRAYDPTLGRFLSRDPLGRAPLFGWADQPYVYAGNNPLVNVDPSGQRFASEGAAQARAAVSYQKRAARIYYRRWSICDRSCWRGYAQGIAGQAVSDLTFAVVALQTVSLLLAKFAAFLGGLAQAALGAAADSVLCFVCAIAFLSLAGVLASASLIVATAALETQWLAIEGGFVLAVFQFAATNGGLTSSYIEQTLKPRLEFIIGAFGIARILWSAWKLLTGQAGVEHLIGGYLNSFLAGGTFLAWSLEQANEMEHDLQRGGL
ncbi:MAG: RHS repeat domain-containing protein, partial [Ktedonobacterales bacterium]